MLLVPPLPYFLFLLVIISLVRTSRQPWMQWSERERVSLWVDERECPWSRMARDRAPTLPSFFPHRASYTQPEGQKLPDFWPHTHTHTTKTRPTLGIFFFFSGRDGEIAYCEMMAKRGRTRGCDADHLGQWRRGFFSRQKSGSQRRSRIYIRVKRNPGKQI